MQLDSSAVLGMGGKSVTTLAPEDWTCPSLSYRVNKCWLHKAGEKREQEVTQNYQIYSRMGIKQLKQKSHTCPDNAG